MILPSMFSAATTPAVSHGLELSTLTRSALEDGIWRKSTRHQKKRCVVDHLSVSIQDGNFYNDFNV